MVDNLRQIEDAIIQQTAMTDSLVEEKTSEAIETLFLSLNLENYITNPNQETDKLAGLLFPGIVEGFAEAIENGIRLSDKIERSAKDEQYSLRILLQKR